MKSYVITLENEAKELHIINFEAGSEKQALIKFNEYESKVLRLYQDVGVTRVLIREEKSGRNTMTVETLLNNFEDSDGVTRIAIQSQSDEFERFEMDADIITIDDFLKGGNELVDKNINLFFIDNHNTLVIYVDEKKLKTS